MQRMFLESSDRRSWSNWSGTTKIQNNMCWVVWQVQRNCRHPCSSSCVIPCSNSSCSWTWRVISTIRMPIVRLPRMTQSFFIWRLKTPIEKMICSDLYSFLCLTETPCRNLFLDEKCENRNREICFFISKGIFCLSSLLTTEHFLFLSTNHCLVFVLHQGMRYQFFWVHHGPLPLPFPFLPAHLTTFQRSWLWNVLVVAPCPKTWSFIIDVATFLQLTPRWPIGRIHPLGSFPQWMFCSYCCRCRSRGEMDSPLSFSVCKNNSTNIVCAASRVVALTVMLRRERELVRSISQWARVRAMERSSVRFSLCMDLRGLSWTSWNSNLEWLWEYRSPLLAWVGEHCFNLFLLFHSGEPHDGHTANMRFERQALESWDAELWWVRWFPQTHKTQTGVEVVERCVCGCE